MKSEINDYKITNLDGISGHHPSYQIRIDNEKPSYIKENSLSSQNENFTEKETFNLEKKTQANNSAKSSNQSSNVSSAGSSSGSSAVSSASSSAAQAAASTTSSLGGLSAVVGGVASSVAAAVMVVVAFVSIMVINISLVMASTNSLIFKLDIQNAQEEDFANPVIAVLEGKDGYYFEQEVFADTVYLTFDELESGSEYTLTVKNDEKIFAQKTYFTASKETQKGSLRVDAKYNRVVASVSCEQLKSGEYFTLTATDDLGKVVYRAEGVEQQKTFSFEVNDVYMLSLTLSVNGKVCDFKQLEIEYLKENDPDIEPIVEPGGHEHNYTPSGYVWNYDVNDGWIAVGKGVCEGCGDILTIPAQMSRDGEVITASITYDGTVYPDDKHIEIDLTDKESVISSDNCYYMKANSFILGNLDSTSSIRYSNDANHLYSIKGSADGIANSLILYNRILTKSDYYLEFDNLNIVADPKENSTILTVQTGSDVVVHIAIRGRASLITSDSYCFNVENTGRNEITVTFDITYIDENSSLYCFDEIYEVPSLYNTESDANIVFKINGVKVDANGAPMEENIDEPIIDEPTDEDPEYDMANYQWGWNNDYTSAYISFPEVHGGEPLIIHTSDIEDSEYPATCDEDGYIIHYASIVYFDNQYETREQEAIEAIGHNYGEPEFEWYVDGNNNQCARAKFTCENDSSHKLTLQADVSINYSASQTVEYVATVLYEGETYTDTFIPEVYGDEPGEEPAEGVELSLDNGTIYIRPNDYAQESKNRNYILNNSAESNPYILSGSLMGSETVEVYNIDGEYNDIEGRGDGEKEVFFFVFDGLNIEGTSWCTAFRIIATNDVDIFITVINPSSITAYNHAAFSLQGQSGVTANIYVTCEDGFESLVCYDSYGERTRVFEADYGMTVNFYMNGIQIDSDGTEL